MSDANALWLKIAFSTAIVLALLSSVTPAFPPARAPCPVAVVIGVCAGATLFTAITRRWPLLPPRGAWTSVLLGRLAFFGLWATNEEILWRRVVLGELLSFGLAPALAASTVGFALMHRTRRLVHLGTGSVFAALYVGTGALVASVAAHWVYNVLVGVLVDRSRTKAELVL